MSLTTPDFDYIRNLVMDKSAIVLEPGKEYLVESRMMPLIHSERLDSISNLVAKMKTNPANGLADKVVDALTTNETSFFRDVHPFEALKTHVLPDLMKKRAASRTLNIWCGASSSGQEPYTIAMVMMHNFPELKNWKINFIASDISNAMLDRCRRGAYSQLEINRGLPAMLMVKFFQRENTEWIVKDELRKLITFQRINLADPLPLMPTLDFVFMRNVMIYFDMETKKKILRGIEKKLAPDGYVFLGAAESTMNLGVNLERLPFNQGGCFQLKGNTS